MRRDSLTLDDDDRLEHLGNSLSSATRRKILRLIVEKSYSLLELARELNIPMSTAAFHVKILRDANLIKAIPNPSKKGNEKNISFECESVAIYFTEGTNIDRFTNYVKLPLGSFTEFNITPPCAICTKDGIIHPLDDLSSFSHPNRLKAQLISFYKGYIVFPIPLENQDAAHMSSITISMEICSECPNYNNSWRSNITFSLCDVELATYLSLGDYGDRRGIYTPAFWGNNSSQYGILVTLKVDKEGTYLNGERVGQTTLKDLPLENKFVMKLKIAVKDDAKYVGGINIFGKEFGDYPQDINVHIAYERKI
ncbi:MAG TPA: helix-turn-helix domain-containing protein [Bacilli bacterium]|nr:helix-turn-helix domain-containing protein [Bacilli bacterium]